MDISAKPSLQKIFNKLPYFRNKELNTSKKKYRYFENFYGKISFIISILGNFISNISFIILSNQISSNINQQDNIDKSDNHLKENKTLLNQNWILTIQISINFLILCVLLIFLMIRKIKNRIILEITIYILDEGFLSFNFWLSNYFLINLSLFKYFLILISLNTFCFLNFEKKKEKKIRKKNFLSNDRIKILYSLIKYLEIVCAININNFQKNFKDFFLEFYIFNFIIFCFLVKLCITQELNHKLKELFLEKNYLMKYYQSLINRLNKSFLSFNISSKLLSVNLSFINFLRILGVKESEIEFLIKNEPIKPEIKENNKDLNNENEKKNYCEVINGTISFSNSSAYNYKIDDKVEKTNSILNLKRSETGNLFLNLSKQNSKRHNSFVKTDNCMKKNYSQFFLKDKKKKLP